MAKKKKAPPDSGSDSGSLEDRIVGILQTKNRKPPAKVRGKPGKAGKAGKTGKAATPAIGEQFQQQIARQMALFFGLGTNSDDPYGNDPYDPFHLDPEGMSYGSHLGPYSGGQSPQGSRGSYGSRPSYSSNQHAMDIFVVKQDGTMSGPFTVPQNDWDWWEVVKDVYPAADGKMYIPETACTFAYDAPRFNACTYDATREYLQARWGRQLHQTDKDWLAQHPLATDAGIPMEYTAMCLHELVEPYGMGIARMRVRRGLVVMSDQDLQFAMALGCNPLGLQDHSTSNAQFVEALGGKLTLAEADKLFRFEFSDEALPGSIVGEAGWSNGTGVQVGYGGGHARYLPPRGSSGNWKVSIQLAPLETLSYRTPIAFPAYVPRHGDARLLLESVKRLDGSQIATKYNGWWYTVEEAADRKTNPSKYLNNGWSSNRRIPSTQAEIDTAKSNDTHSHTNSTNSTNNTNSTNTPNTRPSIDWMNYPVHHYFPDIGSVFFKRMSANLVSLIWPNARSVPVGVPYPVLRFKDSNGKDSYSVKFPHETAYTPAYAGGPTYQAAEWYFKNHDGDWSKENQDQKQLPEQPAQPAGHNPLLARCAYAVHDVLVQDIVPHTQVCIDCWEEQWLGLGCPSCKEKFAVGHTPAVIEHNEAEHFTKLACPGCHNMVMVNELNAKHVEAFPELVKLSACCHDTQGAVEPHYVQLNGTLIGAPKGGHSPANSAVPTVGKVPAKQVPPDSDELAATLADRWSVMDAAQRHEVAARAKSPFIDVLRDYIGAGTEDDRSKLRVAFALPSLGQLKLAMDEVRPESEAPSDAPAEVTSNSTGNTGTESTNGDGSAEPAPSAVDSPVSST